MCNRFATMRSSGSKLFHAQVFQQRLICFNTKRMQTSRENKCCRQKQSHSHTILNIYFRLVLGESDLFVSRQVTFSRHYTTFVLGIHLSEFSFQILWTSERVRFFFKMAKFLLVGYFHFWAKPFSFWAKRCGRN